MPRLPIPYQDEDWGPVLNEYLLQSLAPDGALRPGSVGGAQIQDNSITPAKLSPAVRNSIPHITVGAQPPAQPRNGDIWFDTSTGV